MTGRTGGLIEHSMNPLAALLIGLGAILLLEDDDEPEAPKVEPESGKPPASTAPAAPAGNEPAPETT